jgi:hypothetical protein
MRPMARQPRLRTYPLADPNLARGDLGLGGIDTLERLAQTLRPLPSQPFRAMVLPF